MCPKVPGAKSDRNLTQCKEGEAIAHIGESTYREGHIYV